MFTRMKGSYVLIMLISGLLLAACGSPAAAPTIVSVPSAVPATAVPATSAPVVVETAVPNPLATEALQRTDIPAQPTAAPEAPVAARLNLNTATGDEFLAGVPEMSNRLVREFLEYRPYVSIQQFRRELGKYIDQSQIAAYEKYVYVPIAVNDSDAATLQQISGLEAAEAEGLIAKRPFASNEAFLTELAQYVSESELALAKSYLAAP